MNDKLLKTAFSEFYLSLIMTQNYVKHNLQGFQKIMKKFDKNLNCKVATTWFIKFVTILLIPQNVQDGAQWQEEKLSVSELKKTQDIDKMLVQVGNMFFFFFLNLKTNPYGLGLSKLLKICYPGGESLHQWAWGRQQEKGDGKVFLKHCCHRTFHFYQSHSLFCPISVLLSAAPRQTYHCNHIHFHISIILKAVLLWNTIIFHLSWSTSPTESAPYI